MESRKIMTVAITFSLLFITVSSLIALSAEAAKPGTGSATGMVTLTVNKNVDGRLKPVEGATVTISLTSLPGKTLSSITDRRGQVSFSTQDIIDKVGSDTIYEASATSSGLTDGCTFFALKSSATSIKSTIIMGSCVSVLFN